MFKEILEKIETQYSSSNAMRMLSRLSQFHRVKASPGYRGAAEFATDVLVDAGLAVEVLSFPSDGKTVYSSYLSPEEWTVEGAELWLTRPRREKLADFFDRPMSLVERSASCRTEAQVVALEYGEEREEYEEKDVEGKIVLARGSPMRVYDCAVEERGAIGLIFDGARKDSNLPDALCDNRFSWSPKDKKCFGFVLTPRKGEKLRSLIEKEAKKGRICRLKVSVDASLGEGEMEVVTALLPGLSEEEVWLIAHLCHPQPSANDNASGASALLESARVLRLLVRDRQLRKPARSIRFILAPEVIGVSAYLTLRHKHRVIAGCNMDMVGQNQSACGSVLLIESPPHASASFSSLLLDRIGRLLLHRTSPPRGSALYSRTRYALTPFTGGSDHSALSDPAVGIPSPMIIQWPDRFYHTDQDTIDKVDPEMLKTAGVLASTAAYFTADVDAEMADWLLSELMADSKIKAIEFFQERLRNGQGAKKSEVAMLKGFLLRRMDSIRRFRVRFGKTRMELQRFVDHEFRNALRHGLLELPERQHLNRWEKAAAELIPTRLSDNPVDLRSCRHLLTKREKEKLFRLRKKYASCYSLGPVLAQFWMDGRRSLLEISDLVEFETSEKDLARFLVQYFRILSRAKLIVLEVKKG